MDDRFSNEAGGITAKLPTGSRVAVLGSTSFWNADSETLCKAIARRLAEHEGWLLLTGGMTGVGITLGDAAVERRSELGLTELVYHLLPRGVYPCKHGITIEAGADYHERREILGRVAHVYLILEGGPGTEHEATVATRRGVPVIPVARTGGYAATCFPQLVCPERANPNDWAALSEPAAKLEAVAESVHRLVESCCPCA